MRTTMVAAFCAGLLALPTGAFAGDNTQCTFSAQDHPAAGAIGQPRNVALFFDDWNESDTTWGGWEEPVVTLDDGAGGTVATINEDLGLDSYCAFLLVTPVEPLAPDTIYAITWSGAPADPPTFTTGASVDETPPECEVASGDGETVVFECSEEIVLYTFSIHIDLGVDWHAYTAIDGEVPIGDLGARPGEALGFTLYDGAGNSTTLSYDVPGGEDTDAGGTSADEGGGTVSCSASPPAYRRRGLVALLI